MPMFIQNKPIQNKNLVPDGEYTACVKEVRLQQTGENIIIRFQLTTPGFEESVVAGFVGAHWRPSTRTSANLRQWCINLGINVVSGHEEDIDLETLIGRECRVFVQGYKSKLGEDRCKVSNALPKEKRLANTQPQSKGLHIGASSMPKPTTVEPKVATVEKEEISTTATSGSESSDDLW